MPQSSSFRALDSTDALDAALQQSVQTPVVLFKHSTTCPISARAQSRLQEMDQDGDPVVYRLIVQESRPLSNDIAERFGIRHESPQIIVLRDGEPVFNTSHGSVRAETIREALSEVSQRS